MYIEIVNVKLEDYFDQRATLPFSVWIVDL